MLSNNLYSEYTFWAQTYTLCKDIQTA